MIRRISIAIALLAALMATRWTLAPKYLFYIDNINFALAVQNFNPVLHQPHPPGYPLFVGLLKLLAVCIPSAEYVQLVAGIIGSLAALLLIWQLGKEMFGPVAGWLAAALLFFQPSFWLAGIGNHVRTFLAAGAIAVALCVWRAWRSPETPRWLYWSAALLGIAAGFRPELLVLVFPLLCSAFVRRRRNATTALAALAILGFVTLAWFSVILWKSGGVSGLAPLYVRQYQTATGSTSVLSGASIRENLRTVVLASYWTGAGVLSWTWALPLVWSRIRLPEAREQLTLLAWWFVPPFLFEAIAFVHDPDATLVSIPVTVLVGGWLLSVLVRERTRAIAVLVAILAMAINVAIFFASPLRHGKDASFAWVRRVGTESTDAIDGIRALSETKPLLVVMNRPLVTPRQISYYFPHQPLVVVDADLRQGCPDNARQFKLPAASRLIWMPPLDGSLPMGQPFRIEHHLDYLDVSPGTAFQIGACKFVVGPQER